VEGALRGGAAAGLRLVETFGWTPERGCRRLAAHRARLARGAATLGVAVDWAGVARALAGIGGAGPLRVRLTVGLDGAAAVETAPAPPAAAAWRLVVAEARLRSDDPWLALKTTRRPAYDAARAALPAGADEAILLNELGEVCDGTITTVFADLGAGVVTPPLAAGVLPGVLRAELLARGRAREAALRPADLAGARLWVGNALRGLIPAHLPGRP
jgi:4-amino-4-deoxychorismate lyase